MLPREGLDKAGGVWKKDGVSWESNSSQVASEDCVSHLPRTLPYTVHGQDGATAPAVPPGKAASWSGWPSSPRSRSRPAAACSGSRSASAAARCPAYWGPEERRTRTQGWPRAERLGEAPGTTLARGEDGRMGAGKGARLRGAKRVHACTRVSLPGLFNEADDKLAHFDGLVGLECDDFLPTPGEVGSVCSQEWPPAPSP